MGAEKKERVDIIIAIVILSLFSIVFFTDCVNAAKYRMIGYDEGYNATVAANLVRYGKYMVSYPEKDIFYVKISTGIPVILPTALIYKFFGINAVTSAIVVIIYSLLSIQALWMLLVIELKKNCKQVYTLSAAAVILLILSDGLYRSISIPLIGEGAALFFLMVSFILVGACFNKKKSFYFFLSGVFLAFSFLTKVSMIFFVVTCFGIVIIEAIITKTITLRQSLLYVLGFCVGFLLLESYKLYQLGSIKEVVAWWKLEIEDMLGQSSGVDFSYSFLDKFNYLESIFPGCNKFSCLAMLFLPVICYIIHILRSIFDRSENEEKLFDLPMLMAGLGGASLIIFFLLLGGNGLMYARRHEVNAISVRFFAVYAICEFALRFLQNTPNAVNKIIAKRLCAFSAVLAVCFLFMPVSKIKNNTDEYIRKEDDFAYNAKLMQEFLKEVDNLPSDATIYCVGWWQEPNVTLFLDRDMHDIFEVIYGREELHEKSYFIVGNYIDAYSVESVEVCTDTHLVRVDRSEVDYEKYTIPYDRKDFDLFAIYRMESNLYGSSL